MHERANISNFNFTSGGEMAFTCFAVEYSSNCFLHLVSVIVNNSRDVFLLSADGYTTDDMTLRWQYGPDSVEGIDNIDMAQFALVGFQLNERNITFEHGELFYQCKVAELLRPNHPNPHILPLSGKLHIRLLQCAANWGHRN